MESFKSTVCSVDGVSLFIYGGTEGEGSEERNKVIYTRLDLHCCCGRSV